MGLARYRLSLMLNEPYAASTLRAIHACSGPYRSHATPRQLVVDHCAHWRDMLAEPAYARLASETDRLRRIVPGIDDALLSYARECAGAAVVSIDASVLVVCALHHLHALAGNRDLDAEAGAKAIGRALKSVRDIVRGVTLDAH
jgi:hypothetical protein